MSSHLYKFAEGNIVSLILSDCPLPSFLYSNPTSRISECPKGSFNVLPFSTGPYLLWQLSNTVQQHTKNFFCILSSFFGNCQQDYWSATSKSGTLWFSTHLNLFFWGSSLKGGAPLFTILPNTVKPFFSY